MRDRDTLARARHREWVERNPVRRWRIKRGLTLQQAAAWLGVHRMTLWFWEQGSPPAEKFVKKVARAIGENIDALREEWFDWIGEAVERKAV